MALAEMKKGFSHTPANNGTSDTNKTDLPEKFFGEI
jgi:hypothetical protein